MSEFSSLAMTKAPRSENFGTAPDLPDGSFHHNFFLEESSRSPSSYNRCNKQTINAGDNPCHFQSPLPYMLAGLAAMVLLVVISLMILACSYLRGYFSVAEGSSAPSNTSAVPGDPENPKAGNFQALHNGFGASPEKIVVILAGQDKPTHLAQPIQVKLAAGQSDDHHQEQEDKKKIATAFVEESCTAANSSSSLEDDSSSNDVDSQNVHDRV